MPERHGVVTGGASGIGAAVVEALLARGEAVTVLDLHEPRSRADSARVGAAIVDVADEEAAPGHTLTPMVRDLVDHGYSLDDVILRTPLGRLATPEQQAAEIVHLLRDATHVTGQCLPVDGGWVVVGR